MFDVQRKRPLRAGRRKLWLELGDRAPSNSARDLQSFHGEGCVETEQCTSVEELTMRWSSRLEKCLREDGGQHDESASE